MSGFESREDITARIKDQADIVKIIGECVELKKSGSRFLGLCPFHGEKTPSFSVHPVKQFFYCFGCGESGDVFAFMMKYHHLDFPGAVKELASRYQIQLPEKPLSQREKKLVSQRKRMVAINKKVAAIYHEYLLHSPQGRAARDYLKKRRIHVEVQKKFQIGYAPSIEQGGWNYLGGFLKGEEITTAESLGLLAKNDRGGHYDRFRDRIMFPIADLTGKVIGFGGRIVGEGKPKYMNSPESPVFNKRKSLFGFYQSQEAIRNQRRAIVVEGNFDLVSLFGGGCENVVAPLGTALTREQLALLKRSCGEGILLFDGDNAGIKAAVRSVPLFLMEELSGKVALLPEGSDPDSYIHEKGVDELNKLINDASPLPEFVFDQLVQKHGLTLDGKRLIVQGLAPLVNAATSSLQQSVVVSHFAKKLDIPVEELKGLSKGNVETKNVSASQPEKEIVLQPLSSAQNHLVRFMVMHPSDFDKLDQAGIRECVQGTIGEVLFLQMRKMLADGAMLHPEELLTVLPEGTERLFVAELLGNVAARENLIDRVGVSDDRGDEVIDLLDWIKRDSLKRRSMRLNQEIQEAQTGGDFDRLQRLLTEKVEIENTLQSMIV